MHKLLFTLILSYIGISIFAQEQTVGLFENDSKSFNGYTLFSPGRSTNTYLINNCGLLVHTWASAYQSNNSVYLLDNGNLLRTCKTTTNPDVGGRIEIIDWYDNIVWAYDFGAEFLLHHDVEPLPNGNILTILQESFTPQEAIEAGRNPLFIETEIKAEKIIEIQPIGENAMNIVWEWRAWDHLVQNYDSGEANYGIVMDHPELLNINYTASTGNNAITDWLHFNSIAYNAIYDQLIISSRNLCEVYIIDHSTTTAEAAGHSGGTYKKGGDILYRYGNPMAFDRGDIDDRKLFFQHDAHWIADNSPDKGKVIVFNNQFTSDISKISVFTPPLDSAGFYTPSGINGYKPTSFDWEFISSDIYSPRISSAQQLPNGNILICAGTTGKFFEVNTDGLTLWKYINPVGKDVSVNQGDDPIFNNVFKIRRYEPDFSGFAGITFEPGLPLELNPWPSDCLIETDTIASIAVKIFLEGPFNGTNMNKLNNIHIPYDQPFDKAPWNYAGTEKVEQIPNNAIDWVLIELRDAASPQEASSQSIIDRKAAFLLEDGTIVNPDGVSNPVFYNSIVKNLYVAVYHRNHLGVLSAFPLNKEDMNLKHDFTQSGNETHGTTTGIKELSVGNWGLFAGDGNADNSIDQNDKEINWNSETGEYGYKSADFNLDGQVDNKDKNESHNENQGNESQIPD